MLMKIGGVGARVRTGGSLLGSYSLGGRRLAFLSLPSPFSFAFSLALPSIGGTPGGCLTHQLEGIDQRSHFRNLT